VVGPYSAVAWLVHGDGVSVSGQVSLQEAAQVMRDERVSSVLVDAGRGIVTERDVTLATAAGIAGTQSVTEIMSENTVSISPAASVVEAAAIMLDEGIRHLVVKDPGQPVFGVVSLRAVMAVLFEVMQPEAWIAVRRHIASRSEVWIG
jgi:signal-transduction protein with cAMP-binding, CBS, and nucleotidyltransferase domain